MNVIVIDDEVSSLSTFLGQVVDEANVNCRFFRDNIDSIVDYCRNNEVEGAFLDMNMPSLRGDKVAELLLGIKPNIRIVFVTGTNATESDLPGSIRKNVLGFLYKPVDSALLKRYLLAMGDKESVLSVKTFGSFDCFIDGRLVRFSSSKSKELFALLVVSGGKALPMDKVITYLWPDKDVEKAKILYRDAVWRLRKTLEEIGFPCVEFSRASLVFNRKNVECDYYDIMDGKDVYYPGEFLPSYDWSYPYESQIDFLLDKKKRN